MSHTEQARRAERKRCQEIYKACDAVGASRQKADEYIANDTSADEVRADLLSSPPGGSSRQSTIRGGADERDKFVEGATNALLARTGLASLDKNNNFASFSLVGMARESARMSGARLDRLRSSMDVAGAGLDPMAYGGHTTSDFSKVLENVATKQVLKGWEEAAESFQKWTRPGNLPDFKPVKRTGLNLFDDLEEIPEGGEYTHGTIGDRSETIQLATYGKMFAISRRALVNDDLSVLSAIPSRMGRAAARTIGGLVYAVLTTNPAMADGTALFHADHSNMATGAPLGVDTLDAARVAMATQKDPEEKAKGGLNIRPRFLIVPVALEGTAKTLMNSQFKPGSANNDINIVSGMAEIISDARLDADSPTTWYLAADGTVYDVIEVAYLNGVQTPTVESQRGWSVDGAQFKVRHDAAVQQLDHRTVYRGEA